MPTTLTKGVASEPQPAQILNGDALPPRERGRRGGATLALLLFPPNVPEQRRNMKVQIRWKR